MTRSGPAPSLPGNYAGASLARNLRHTLICRIECVTCTHSYALTGMFTRSFEGVGYVEMCGLAFSFIPGETPVDHERPVDQGALE
jgi:hypothetical protein